MCVQFSFSLLLYNFLCTQTLCPRYYWFSRIFVCAYVCACAHIKSGWGVILCECSKRLNIKVNVLLNVFNFSSQLFHFFIVIGWKIIFSNKLLFTDYFKWFFKFVERNKANLCYSYLIVWYFIFLSVLSIVFYLGVTHIKSVFSPFLLHWHTEHCFFIFNFLWVYVFIVPI